MKCESEKSSYTYIIIGVIVILVTALFLIPFLIKKAPTNNIDKTQTEIDTTTERPTPDPESFMQNPTEYFIPTKEKHTKNTSLNFITEKLESFTESASATRY